MNDGDSHILTSTTGTVSTDYVYRANDMYDPYAGVGGNQPRGFDQYMAMFRNFAVLGSKVTINVGYGQASATSNDMLVAIVTQDGSTSITNKNTIRESPRLRYRMCTASNGRTSLSSTYSFKINGVKDVIDNDKLWGTSSSSPTEQWYYHVVAYQPDGNTDTLTFTGHIEYTAIFFHAITPPAS